MLLYTEFSKILKISFSNKASFFSFIITLLTSVTSNGTLPAAPITIIISFTISSFKDNLTATLILAIDKEFLFPSL